jgi:hypothetical protein
MIAINVGVMAGTEDLPELFLQRLDIRIYRYRLTSTMTA